MSQMNKLGSMPVGRLLFNMALPACSGILVIMLYNVIDTMFVGHFAGPMANCRVIRGTSGQHAVADSGHGDRRW